MTNACRKKRCALFESCDDNIRNQDETDVDCGGLTCPGCADLKACKEHRDCDSVLCERKKCAIVESCEDNIKNQDESDIDCGGVKCPRCALWKKCKDNCDCISDTCKNKTCAVAESCMDGMKNQEETDIDCGGDQCAKCEDLKLCDDDCDCISGLCENNQCTSSFEGNWTTIVSNTDTTTEITSVISTNPTKTTFNTTTISSIINTTTSAWTVTSTDITMTSTTLRTNSTTTSSTSTTSSSTTTSSTSTSTTVTLNGTCPSKSIVWKGYTWCLRNDLSNAPGLNNYLTDNVWIDDKGLLHLRIINTSDIWTSAALYTANRFNFGTFQWQIEAFLNVLDPKAVLSLYTSSLLITGINKTNEIDIEFTRWGSNSSTTPNLFYNVWPTKDNEPKSGTALIYNQTSIYTTQRFIWSSESVIFKSISGFRNDDSNIIQSWQSSTSFSKAVPQMSAPIHMNLWIFHMDNNDRFPSNSKPIEIIIHDFVYHPLKSSTISTVTYETSVIIFSTLLSTFCILILRNTF
ncbi:hypothetical protein I4U23_014000 [Adineta vaga]|nr:hypothetical protein I4U23_014000 [Adineta vaga]